VILVDTSVLIDYFKNANAKHVSVFDTIISNKLPFGINSYIYQEVLQGSRNESEYKILKEYLCSLPFYYLKNGLESFSNAAMLNMKCRNSGLTIRSTIDLLIVQTALENDLFLLHNDRDFTNISKVTNSLKIYEY
jgi:predicted nucleic acid-binding protein